jgi:hypothetical protein
MAARLKQNVMATGLNERGPFKPEAAEKIFEKRHAAEQAVIK